MKAYFGVGDASTAKRLLAGHGAMVSHAYIGSSWVPLDDFEALLDLCDGMMLDSGAFTAWNNGKPLGDKEIEQYIEFVRRYRDRLDGAVTVDVIGDANASLKRWKASQALGVDLIPVWHEGDPIEHLQEYNPDERLVFLGRIEGRKSKQKTFEFYDLAFNLFPGGEYHAGGTSTPEYLEPFPFRRFDATTWQRNSGYSLSLGWPWCACSKETRMVASIEAIETIKYRPRNHAQMRLAL